jgi:hypothetical protein
VQFTVPLAHLAQTRLVASDTRYALPHCGYEPFCGHSFAFESDLTCGNRVLAQAKQGYVIYRVRVKRGGRKRPVSKGIVYGKPKFQGITHLKNQVNMRNIAEQRVGRLVPSLRVLNSYWVAQDATYKYYEVILVDPFHNAIRRDPRINWICNVRDLNTLFLISHADARLLSLSHVLFISKMSFVLLWWSSSCFADLTSDVRCLSIR